MPIEFESSQHMGRKEEGVRGCRQSRAKERIHWLLDCTKHVDVCDAGHLGRPRRGKGYRTIHERGRSGLSYARRFVEIGPRWRRLVETTIDVVLDAFRGCM